MDDILHFEVDNWKILEDDQYMTLGELYIVNKGLNPNQTYFSEECIWDGSETLPLKPIVCQFNNFKNPKASDFTSHAKNDYDKEVRKVVGVVPNPSGREMVEYMGKQYLKCRVVFFKHYYPDIINKLIDNDKQGKRTKISMEIAVKEAVKRDDGILEIRKFVFLGISLLGNDIESGIENAGCFLLKYSQDDLSSMIDEANKRFVKYKIPDVVKENVRQALETKQKNPKLIYFAKSLLSEDEITYSKIESIKDKIDHVRKDENINFYGGKECLTWCEEILGYEKGDNNKMDYEQLYNELKTQFDSLTEQFEAKTKEYEELKTQYEEKCSAYEEKEKELDEQKNCAKEEKECFEKQISDLTEEKTILTQNFEQANTELTELRTYKLENEKEKLTAKANLMFEKEEYKEIFSKEEKDNLFSILYEKGYEDFEAKFSLLALPKVLARQATNPNPEPQEQHYSAPIMGDLSKEDNKIPTDPYERAKARVAQSGLM